MRSLLELSGIEEELRSINSGFDEPRVYFGRIGIWIVPSRHLVVVDNIHGTWLTAF